MFPTVHTLRSLIRVTLRSQQLSASQCLDPVLTDWSSACDSDASTPALRFASKVLHQEASTSGRSHQLHRKYSTADLRVVHTDVPEAEFHKAADKLLDHLHDVLEAYTEDADIDGADVEYSQGVLTVKLGSHGTYVINKQTPNRQIWLSSPVSGPFRFDLTNGRWIYSRDGRDLVHQLEAEISQLAGRSLTLDS